MPATGPWLLVLVLATVKAEESCYNLLFDKNSTVLYSHSMVGPERILKRGSDVTITCIAHNAPGCLYEPVIHHNVYRNCSRNEEPGSNSVARTFCDIDRVPTGGIKFECQPLNSSCVNSSCGGQYYITKVIGEPLDFNISCVYHPAYITKQSLDDAGFVMCRINPSLSVQKNITMMERKEGDYSGRYILAYSLYAKELKWNAIWLHSDAPINIAVSTKESHIAIQAQYRAPYANNRTKSVYVKDSPLFNSSLINLAAPPTITDFNLTSISQSEVCFDWTIETDVTDYIVRVQYSIDSSDDATSVQEWDGTNSTEGCINGLEPNTTYSLEMSIKRTESIYWTPADQTKKLTVVTSSLPLVQRSTQKELDTKRLSIILASLAAVMTSAGVIAACLVCRRKFKKKLDFSYVTSSIGSPVRHTEKYVPTSGIMFENNLNMHVIDGNDLKKGEPPIVHKEHTTQEAAETDEETAGYANAVMEDQSSSSELDQQDNDETSSTQGKPVYAVMPTEGQVVAALNPIGPNNHYIPKEVLDNGEGIQSLVEVLNGHMDNDLSVCSSSSFEMSETFKPALPSTSKKTASLEGVVSELSTGTSGTSGYDSMPDDRFINSLINQPISLYSKATPLPAENDCTLNTENDGHTEIVSSYLTENSNDDVMLDSSGSFDYQKQQTGIRPTDEPPTRSKYWRKDETFTTPKCTTYPVNKTEDSYQRFPANYSSVAQATNEELTYDDSLPSSGGLTSGVPSENFVSSLLHVL